MATLKTFELKPIAGPEDPNWDIATDHGRVLVRAYSPADARIVAAEAEPDFLTQPAKPGDGNSTRFASAFRNDKLYTVSEAGKNEKGAKRGVLTPFSKDDVLATDLRTYTG